VSTYKETRKKCKGTAVMSSKKRSVILHDLYLFLASMTSLLLQEHL